MNLFSLPSSRVSFIRQLRWPTLCRHNSILTHPETVDFSFKRLGVPASVAATLRAAFPEIQSPTKTQSELIPAIISGKDVLLRDRTGTGKSFGLILALLSDFRVWRSAHEAHKVPDDPSISSIIIVPHRDLAYQLSHWIQLFADSKLQAQRPSLPAIVQVLVRSSTTPLETQLETLKTVTPHILIGTPQVLLEQYNQLKLHKLNTVVVDEVDYLVETVPNLADKYRMEKLRKKIQKHPGPTRQLLDLVLAPRMTKTAPSQKPQLVLSSATMRSHLNRFLYQESGWLQRGGDNLVKIKGDQQESDTPVRAPSNVSHSTIVVTQDGEIRNIEGSVPRAEDPAMEVPNDSEMESYNTTPSLYQPARDFDEFSAVYSGPPPWNPSALEAISICFAMDVPRVALLVVPSSAPVQRVVQELRALEVNAQGLDLLSPEAGKNYLLRGDGNEPEECPTLLVSTLASTRGLDLPQLSHVFILGMPEGRIDSYMHMAGRTGRFGKPGQVITVVEREEEETEDGVKVVKDEEKRMKGMFKEMGIIPVKVDHFE